MLNYICTKSGMPWRKKKCKYAQEMIEMIFNIYKTCSIY
jgi:hypothetical protein